MQALASWVAPGTLVIRGNSVSFLQRRLTCPSRGAPSLVVACTRSSNAGRKQKRLAPKKQDDIAETEDEDEDDVEEGDDVDDDEYFGPSFKAPAGFVLDYAGELALVAPVKKRVVKLTDPKTGRFLECVIRRAFHSSSGEYCLLLYPLDTPVHVLKFEEENGGLLREVSEEDLEEVLPAVEYALVKKRMTLVNSSLCLTARGSFFYTENNIMDVQKGELLLTPRSTLDSKKPPNGVEVTTFAMDGGEYVIFTPFEPVRILACRDEVTGNVTLADEDLYKDEHVRYEIEEEQNFIDCTSRE